MQAFRRAALTATIVLIAAAPAGAASKPDLTVSKLAEPPGTVAPGGQLKVSDTLRNAGRGRARATTVTYWLSADRRQGRGDLRIGSRKAKALKGRKRAGGRRTLRLPAVIKPGSYFLIACADGSRKVRERSERNNCRSSKRRLRIATGITAPAAPALPVAPAAPAPAPGPVPQPDPTPAPTPEPTPDPGGDVTEPDFPVAADPLTVEHVTQTDRAVTQEVTTAGGTVQATAEDGTVYKLTLPKFALVSPTRITLTPVDSVTGPLSGGLVGAVEILPHGLELLSPATLTIDPAGDPGPIAGQTGFLSHGEGEDFHLYPLGLGGEITMSLTHFSTPGVAQATDADRQVVLSHPPERHRAQYEQMMEDVIRDTRIAQEANADTPLPGDQIAAILRGYWNDIVWPLVQQASNDDTVAARAISEMLSWARQIELLSLSEHPKLKVLHEAVWEHVVVILENAINQGYSRCVDDHDLDFIVRLVGLARTAALLGLGLDEAALDKAMRCANFELDFESLITKDYTAGGPGQVSDHREIATWHVESLDIPIDMTGISQNNTLSWRAFDYSYTIKYPCATDGLLTYVTTDAGRRPDTSVTVQLGMDLNAREPGTPPPTDRDIQVRLFGIDDIAETYQQTATTWCGEQPPAATDPYEAERWRGHYESLHIDEFLSGIRDWELGTGDLVATKTYNRSTPNASGGLSELTTLSLWHKPQK